ncbi:hypothetical protein KVT40_005168 [Elsinoe batatas]|uniref:Uncharacterized protein n=1 Tax=Elsinoe batatas TaxID=2601811 RepID=A0A8K0L106_9PEZI|nr:hypothetical protein KVT40_005168 [Elsinoe batatas]
MTGPTTPPPPGRLRTPPTPLHGPKYDNHEPYSPPRRSARVQEKQKQELDTSPSSISAVRHWARSHVTQDITSTPRAERVKLNRQSSQQTLSPPSSPESLHKSQSTALPAIDEMHSRLVARYDGNVDAVQAFEGAFPTPRKTPRRRDGTSNSRVINIKPHDSQHIFPTPKRRVRYTLDSPTHSPSAPTKVFIDSQDRQPEMEASKDNPFVGPRHKTKSSRRSHYRMNREERQMDELVKEGKGMVYTFRGKRIFRAYSEDHDNSEDDSEPSHIYSSQSARVAAAAGPSAERPLTRSHLKPRLLFTSDDHAQSGSFTDEEALTDIEEKDDAGGLSEPQGVDEPIDEIAQSHAVALPLVATSTIAQDTPSLAPPQNSFKGKKPSPFDSWPRQKAGSAASMSSGTKRPAPSPEEQSVGKRTRSHASPNV